MSLGQIHIEDNHITTEILHLIFIICHLGTPFQHFRLAKRKNDNRSRDENVRHLKLQMGKVI